MHPVVYCTDTERVQRKAKEKLFKSTGENFTNLMKRSICATDNSGGFTE